MFLIATDIDTHFQRATPNVEMATKLPEIKDQQQVERMALPGHNTRSHTARGTGTAKNQFPAIA